MVTNFEEITENLSEKELSNLASMKKIIPLVMQEGEFYKSPELISNINYELAGHYKICGVSLRKWTNYFRTNSIFPIVATKNGYCLTYDNTVIESQIRSLNERSSSIRKAAIGMQTFLINQTK